MPSHDTHFLVGAAQHFRSGGHAGSDVSLLDQRRQLREDGGFAKGCDCRAMGPGLACHGVGGSGMAPAGARGAGEEGLGRVCGLGRLWRREL